MTTSGTFDLAREFRRYAERRVQEGNLLADEHLWEVVAHDDARLTIRCAACPDDSVDCFLDFNAGILTCAPGPAISRPPLVFQLVPGGLRSCGVDYTLDGAVAAVLDELVWLEETEKAS